LDYVGHLADILSMRERPQFGHSPIILKESRSSSSQKLTRDNRKSRWRGASAFGRSAGHETDDDGELPLGLPRE
jgi:hypothetical protein